MCVVCVKCKRFFHADRRNPSSSAFFFNNNTSLSPPPRSKSFRASEVGPARRCSLPARLPTTRSARSGTSDTFARPRPHSSQTHPASCARQQAGGYICTWATNTIVAQDARPRDSVPLTPGPTCHVEPHRRDAALDPSLNTPLTAAVAAADTPALDPAVVAAVGAADRPARGAAAGAAEYAADGPAEHSAERTAERAVRGYYQRSAGPGSPGAPLALLCRPRRHKGCIAPRFGDER